MEQINEQRMDNSINFSEPNQHPDVKWLWIQK